MANFSVVSVKIKTSGSHRLSTRGQWQAGGRQNQYIMRNDTEGITHQIFYLPFKLRGSLQGLNQPPVAMLCQYDKRVDIVDLNAYGNTAL
jgi:hypothetical protein